jgi:hypothetical protein
MDGAAATRRNVVPGFFMVGLIVGEERSEERNRRDRTKSCWRQVRVVVLAK